MTETEAWAAQLPPHEGGKSMVNIDTSTEAVERLLDGVTPGPWQVDGPSWNQIIWSSNGNRVCFMAHSNGLNVVGDLAAASFIAAARDLVPALLKERDDLRAKLTEARAELHGPIKHLSARDYSNVIAHLSPELEPNGELPNRNSLMMALVEATNAAKREAARADRAEAALAADPVTNAGSCQPMKVKPLVWVDVGADCISADVYSVGPTYGQGPERFMLTRGTKIIRWGDQPEPLKAAAQADFEARILAAIEPAPVTPAAAAKVLLADKVALATLVDVAEEEHDKGVSFGAVIGRALRAVGRGEA